MLKLITIERQKDIFKMPSEKSWGALPGFESMNRFMSEGRSWTRRLIERLFLTEVKVRLFGFRIHHAYVGAGIMLSSLLQQISNIYGFILFALGIFTVFHDLICHLIYKRLAKRLMMFENMLTYQREQRVNLTGR